MQADLEPASFEALPDFASDDFVEALACFQRSAKLIASDAPSQRPGVKPGPELVAACRAALSLGADVSQGKARIFFTDNFQPFRLKGPGFVTAYYEPEVEAKLEPDANFGVPVLSRPSDLVTLNDAPYPRTRWRNLDQRASLRRRFLDPLPRSARD